LVFASAKERPIDGESDAIERERDGNVVMGDDTGEGEDEKKVRTRGQRGGEKRKEKKGKGRRGEDTFSS